MYILEVNHGSGEIHRYFLIPGREYTVGRKECDILLPLGEPSISRHHATIVVAAMPRYVALDPKAELEISVRDFSKHGTFVDRERVGKDNSRFVYPEDQIRFGMRVTGRVMPMSLTLGISPGMPDAALEEVLTAAVQIGAHVSEERVPSPQEFYDRHANCLGFLFVSEDHFVMDVPMMEALGYGYTLVTTAYLQTLANDLRANFSIAPTELPAPVSPTPESLALRNVHYRRPAQTFYSGAEFISMGKPLASRVFKSYTFLLVEDNIKSAYNRVLEVFGGAVVQVAVDNLSIWKSMPTDQTTVCVVGEAHFKSISDIVMSAGSSGDAAGSTISTAHADPAVHAYLELYVNHLCLIPEENVHLALYRDDQSELNRKPSSCYLQRPREEPSPRADAASTTAAAPSPPAPAADGPAASESKAVDGEQSPLGAKDRRSRDSTAPASSSSTAAAAGKDGHTHMVRKTRLSPASSSNNNSSSSASRSRANDSSTGAPAEGLDAATAEVELVESAKKADGAASNGASATAVGTSSANTSGLTSAEAPAGERTRASDRRTPTLPASPYTDDHASQARETTASPEDSAAAATAAAESAAEPDERSAEEPVTRQTDDLLQSEESAQSPAVDAPSPAPAPTSGARSRLPPKSTVSAAMRAVEAGVSKRANASDQRRVPISAPPSSAGRSSAAPVGAADEEGRSTGVTEKSPSPEMRDMYARRTSYGGDRRLSIGGDRRPVVIHEAAQAVGSPGRRRVEAVRLTAAARAAGAPVTEARAGGASRASLPRASGTQSVDPQADAEDLIAGADFSGPGSPSSPSVHRGVVRRATARRDGPGMAAHGVPPAPGSGEFQRSESARIREMNAATPMRLTSTRVSSSVPRNRPPTASAGQARARAAPSWEAAANARGSSPYSHVSARRHRSGSNSAAPSSPPVTLTSATGPGASGTAALPGQIPGLRSGSVASGLGAGGAAGTDGYGQDATLGRECCDFMRDFLDGFMTNTERTTRAVLRQTYLDSTSKQYLEDGVTQLQDFLVKIHKTEQEIPPQYSTEATRKNCHEVRQKSTYTLRKIKGTYDAVHVDIPPCLTRARDALSTRTSSPRRHFRYNSVSTATDSAYRRQNFRDKDF